MTIKERFMKLLLAADKKRNQAFERVAVEEAFFRSEQALYKFVFDVLRNSLITGLLIYFYVKSHNPFLYWAFYISLFANALFVSSNLQYWIVVPIEKLLQFKFPFWLRTLIRLAVSVAIFFAFLSILTELVFAIGEAYIPS